MANFKRTAIKFGSGFLGGLSTGGWGGAFTGGTVAAFTGGKAKPLKSAAIGAGSGFFGGYTARKLNLQGDTTTMPGGFTFKPLSSKAFDWMNSGPKTTALPGTPGVPAKRGTPTLPNAADFFGGASAAPVADPVFSEAGAGAGGSWYPSASDYQDAQGDSGGGWLPVAVAVGALFLVGAA